MDIAKNADWEKEKLVSVSITCLRCGKTDEFKVHRSRKLPRKVYWECPVCLNEKHQDGIRPVA